MFRERTAEESRRIGRGCAESRRKCHLRRIIRGLVAVDKARLGGYWNGVTAIKLVPVHKSRRIDKMAHQGVIGAGNFRRVSCFAGDFFRTEYKFHFFRRRAFSRRAKVVNSRMSLRLSRTQSKPSEHGEIICDRRDLNGGREALLSFIPNSAPSENAFHVRDARFYSGAKVSQPGMDLRR